jgi:hypothetical protein
MFFCAWYDPTSRQTGTNDATDADNHLTSRHAHNARGAAAGELITDNGAD